MCVYVWYVCVVGIWVECVGIWGGVLCVRVFVYMCACSMCACDGACLWYASVLCTFLSVMSRVKKSLLHI